ncbi:hypothetical protein ScPMuIL_000272, partial [Solemya velum]
IFEKFSSFLHWLIEYRTKHSTLDHYLDDFIFAGPRDTPVFCEVPRIGPRCTRNSRNSPSTLSKDDLQSEAIRLLNASIAPNTKLTYNTGLQAFSQFRSEWDDVSLDKSDTMILLKIRYSKTDQTGKGTTLVIPQGTGILCPVQHLKEFLSVRPQGGGSVFT